MPAVREVVWVDGSATVSFGQAARQEGPAEAVCAFGGVPNVFEGLSVQSTCTSPCVILFEELSAAASE